MKKRILSCILAICMTFSLIPATVTSVFATNDPPVGTVRANIVGTADVSEKFNMTIVLNEGFVFKNGSDAGTKALDGTNKKLEVTGDLVKGGTSTISNLSVSDKSATFSVEFTPASGVKKAMTDESTDTDLLTVALASGTNIGDVIEVDSTVDPAPTLPTTAVFSMTGVTLNVGMTAAATLTALTDTTGGGSKDMTPADGLVVQTGHTYTGRIKVALTGGTFDHSGSSGSEALTDAAKAVSNYVVNGLPTGMTVTKVDWPDVSGTATAGDCTAVELHIGMLDANKDGIQGDGTVGMDWKDVTVQVKPAALTNGTESYKESVLVDSQVKTKTLNTYTVTYTTNDTSILRAVKEIPTDATLNSIDDKAFAGYTAVGNDAKTSTVKMREGTPVWVCPVVPATFNVSAVKYSEDGQTWTDMLKVKDGTTGEPVVIADNVTGGEAANVYIIPGTVTHDVTVQVTVGAAQTTATFKEQNSEQVPSNELHYIVKDRDGKEIKPDPTTGEVPMDAVETSFTIEALPGYEVKSLAIEDDQQAEVDFDLSNGVYTVDVAGDYTYTVIVDAYTWNIKGTLMDKANVNLLQDATVNLYKSDDLTTPVADPVTTTPKGVFTFRGIEKGTYTAVVTGTRVANGNTTTCGGYGAIEFKDIVVPTTEDMAPGATITLDTKPVAKLYTVEVVNAGADGVATGYTQSGVYGEGMIAAEYTAGVPVKAKLYKVSGAAPTMLELAELDEVSLFGMEVDTTAKSKLEISDGTVMTFCPVAWGAGQFDVKWYVQTTGSDGTAAWKDASQPSDIWTVNEDKTLTVTVNQNLVVACALKDQTDSSAKKYAVKWTNAERDTNTNTTTSLADDVAIKATVSNAEVTMDKNSAGSDATKKWTVLTAGDTVNFSLNLPAGTDESDYRFTWSIGGEIVDGTGDGAYVDGADGTHKADANGSKMTWKIGAEKTDAEYTDQSDSGDFDKALVVACKIEKLCAVTVTLTDTAKSGGTVTLSATGPATGATAANVPAEVPAGEVQADGTKVFTFKILNKSKAVTAAVKGGDDTKYLYTWGGTTTTGFTATGATYAASDDTVTTSDPALTVAVEPFYTVEQSTTIKATPSAGPSKDVQVETKTFKVPAGAGVKFDFTKSTPTAETAQSHHVYWKVTDVYGNKEFTKATVEKAIADGDTTTFAGITMADEFTLTLAKVEKNISVECRAQAYFTLTLTTDQNFVTGFMVGEEAAAAGTGDWTYALDTDKTSVKVTPVLKPETDGKTYHYDYKWTGSDGSTALAAATFEDVDKEALGIKAALAKAEAVKLTVAKQFGITKAEGSENFTVGTTEFAVDSSIQYAAANTQVTLKGTVAEGNSYYFEVSTNGGTPKRYDKTVTGCSLSPDGKTLELTLTLDNNIEVKYVEAQDVTIEYSFEGANKGEMTALVDGKEKYGELTVDKSQTVVLKAKSADKLAAGAACKWKVGTTPVDGDSDTLDLTSYLANATGTLTVTCELTPLYPVKKVLTDAKVDLGSIGADGNGSFKAQDKDMFAKDDMVVIAITPTEGYTVEDVTVNNGNKDLALQKLETKPKGYTGTGTVWYSYKQENVKETTVTVMAVQPVEVTFADTEEATVKVYKKGATAAQDVEITSGDAVMTNTEMYVLVTPLSAKRQVEYVTVEGVPQVPTGTDPTDPYDGKVARWDFTLADANGDGKVEIGFTMKDRKLEVTPDAASLTTDASSVTDAIGKVQFYAYENFTGATNVLNLSEGDGVYFEITPNTGKEVDKVTYEYTDGTTISAAATAVSGGTAPTSRWKFTMPGASVTLKATFKDALNDAEKEEDITLTVKTEGTPAGTVTIDKVNDAAPVAGTADNTYIVHRGDIVEYTIDAPKDSATQALTSMITGVTYEGTEGGTVDADPQLAVTGEDQVKSSFVVNALTTATTFTAKFSPVFNVTVEEVEAEGLGSQGKISKCEVTDSAGKTTSYDMTEAGVPVLKGQSVTLTAIQSENVAKTDADCLTYGWSDQATGDLDVGNTNTWMKQNVSADLHVRFQVIPKYRVIFEDTNAAATAATITAAYADPNKTGTITSNDAALAPGTEVTFTATTEGQSSGNCTYTFSWQTSSDGKNWTPLETTENVVTKPSHSHTMAINGKTYVKCDVSIIREIKIVSDYTLTACYVKDGQEITGSAAPEFVTNSSGKQTAVRVDATKDVKFTAPETAGYTYTWTPSGIVQAQSNIAILPASNTTEVVTCDQVPGYTVNALIVGGAAEGAMDLEFAFKQDGKPVTKYNAVPESKDGDKKYTVSVEEGTEITITVKEPGTKPAGATTDNFQWVYNWEGLGDAATVSADKKTCTISSAAAGVALTVNAQGQFKYTINLSGGEGTVVQGTAAAAAEDATREPVVIWADCDKPLTLVPSQTTCAARWYSDRVGGTEITNATEGYSVADGKLTVDKVTGSATLYCNFVEKTTLTIGKPTNGTVTPDGNTVGSDGTCTYLEGDQIILLVKPNAGYEVDGKVTLGKDAQGADIEMTTNGTPDQSGNLVYTYDVTAETPNALTLSVAFKLKDLAITNGNVGDTAKGSIKFKVGVNENAATAQLGDDVYVVGEPVDGWGLKGITVAPELAVAPVLQADGSWKFKMPGTPVTVTAEFEQVTEGNALSYELPGDNGTIAVTYKNKENADVEVKADGSVKVPNTKNVTVVVTPNSSNGVKSLTIVSGEGASAQTQTLTASPVNGVYTFNFAMPNAATKLTVNFSGKILLNLTAGDGIDGFTVQVTGEKTAREGTKSESTYTYDLTSATGSVTVTAVPTTPAEGDAKYVYTWTENEADKDETTEKLYLGQVTGTRSITCSVAEVTPRTVSGTVDDGNINLPEADMTAIKVKLFAKTGDTVAETAAYESDAVTAAGGFSIGSVLPGVYVARVEKNEEKGYDVSQTEVDVTSGDATGVVITLKELGKSFTLKSGEGTGDDATPTLPVYYPKNEDGSVGAKSYAAPELPEGWTAPAGKQHIGWNYSKTTEAGTETVTVKVGNPIPATDVGETALVLTARYEEPKTETTAPPPDENGATSAAVNADKAENAVDAAINAGSTEQTTAPEVIFEAKTEGDTPATNVSVDLPKATVDKIADGEKTTVDETTGEPKTDKVEIDTTIKTDVAEVTLPQKAVDAASTAVENAEGATKVRVEVKNTTATAPEAPAGTTVAAAVEVNVKTVKDDGTPVGANDGSVGLNKDSMANKKVTIRINVGTGHDGDSVAIWDIVEGVYNKIVDWATVETGGWVTFKTPHLSQFGLLFASKAEPPVFVEGSSVTAAADDKTATLTLADGETAADKYLVYNDADCTQPSTITAELGEDGKTLTLSNGDEAIPPKTYYIVAANADDVPTSGAAAVSILSNSTTAEINVTTAPAALGATKYTFNCTGAPAGVVIVATIKFTEASGKDSITFSCTNGGTVSMKNVESMFIVASEHDADENMNFGTVYATKNWTPGSGN